MTRHCHHFARPQKQEALETINIGKAVASPDIQYAILPGDHGHGFTRVEQAAAIDLVKLRFFRLDISPTLVCHADNCERRFEAQFFGDLPGYRHVGHGPSPHTQIPRLTTVPEQPDLQFSAFHLAPFRLSACRSEEHTSELQSLMRISYAVF